jgi:hypothetical protein
MGLADDLAGITSKKTGGRKALVARILDSLNPEDRAALEAALANRDRYSSRAISLALRAQGITCSEASIYNWRTERVEK